MTITQLCSEPVPIQEGKGAIFLKAVTINLKKSQIKKIWAKMKKNTHTHNSRQFFKLFEKGNFFYCWKATSEWDIILKNILKKKKK